MDPTLRDRALRWIADDPDPETRAELQALVAAGMTGGDTGALAAAMAGPLTFGTAGLRGPVRAGPAGMNVAVVRRATAGLAAWLRARWTAGGTGGGSSVGAGAGPGSGGAGAGATGPVVVVGRDARHGSEVFAAEAAGVLAAAGFAAHVLPAPLPTPLLAFAVRRLGAVAGIQVTASHNPKADNGYKVYLEDGAQLVPPADAEIEAAIAAQPAAVSIPVGGPTVEYDPTEEYLARVASLGRAGGELRLALTPLHGVGGALAVQALSRSGFTDVHVVREQAAPDPDFPTVAFPNPEEPGATDLLLALADRVGADLAIALDPDADRCALAVPTPAGWRLLTGDETGVLLGDAILRERSGLVATTVVSSSMLARVAAAHGAGFAETLTGFKWIVRGGPDLVYGYEEAIGYCVDPEAVRDKDGISAAVVAAGVAAELRAQGRTLLDRLDELSRAHGVHRTVGISRRMEPAAGAAAVARLVADPPAGWAADRPAPDVLRLRRAGARAVVRPSGTEPKLKIYLEVVEDPTDDLAGARARADTRMAALREEVEALIG
ncbi:phospho-sugar mutase [Pseudonocardia sp. WMMC193]|uniref:phospho-sugar mutase n=1 Tax=Pseudonocardia sp. WMMC193 TaxID=2911965 RepID=UPI001F4702B3|nr:phospho-sugar mutase [Pseudonocardia sp. WMMC193]MCF7553243.1 phospho-sugar mutase [Pseudonocardia sp. WMMC193]